MNQHNPFLYVEIAWIMIMFNNSHYLLFYFLYISIVVCFLFTVFCLFIYFLLLNLVLVSLFLFRIIIAWHVFFYYFSFMIVFNVLLFHYSYYLLLLSFAFCFFFLALISWFFISIIKHYSIIHYSPDKLDCVLLIQLSKGNMWGFVLIVYFFFLFLCDSYIHSFLLQYPF